MQGPSGSSSRAQSRFSALVVGCVVGATVALAIPAASQARGFSATQVSELNTMVNDMVQQDGYPGIVVGIWGPNGERYVRAVGDASLQPVPRPMSTADRFRIGSITKTFVGTLILELVKQRLLRLNEPISHFFSWIPKARSITIQMLLNHTSGIPDIAPSTIGELLAHPAKRFNPDQVIRTAVAQKYTPAGTFNYSDVNYMILGRIAEKVTGEKSLKQLMAQDILKPLGLDHTYFDPTTKIRGVHARAVEEINGKQVDVTKWSTSYTWAAGSMVSTLGDLKLWAKDVVQGALLDRKLQRERETFIPTGEGYNYGLGLIQLGEFCGHNGLIYGYDSTMLYSSKLHATMVILGNANPLLDSPPLSAWYPPAPAVPDTLNLAVALAPIAFPNPSSGGSGSLPC